MSSTDVSLKLKDEGRLAELGYKQELRREWGLIHNFGASFSIISVVTGITTLFSYGLNTGGPGVMTVGWIVVSCFTLMIGASMAEILSAVPTSGGPYFWAYMLAPPGHAPFFAWITGWFNLLGQVAVTTAVDFSLAQLISTVAEVKNGYNPSPGKTLGIHALILLTHCAINFLNIRPLRFVIYSSIALQSLGISCLAIVVLLKAPKLKSPGFVFTTFYDGTGGEGEGWGVRASDAYVGAVGVLFSQYTLLGYDASAHLCEETRRAVRHAPLGMIYAVAGSAIFGFFLLVSLLFSIDDFETVRTAKQPVLQILTDACGTDGGIILMVLIMLCIWHCGLFSLTSNSRMMFAFARDGGIPHKLHIIDRGFESPIRTVLFGACCAFLLALPSLGSSVAFSGTTSIATSGLYISYGIPIAMGLVWRKQFKRGPFNLGSLSKPIALISCLWICFITIVFCLPTTSPVTSQTLNYTPVALGIIAIFAFGSWWLWAHRWFTGRCRHHCRICIRQLDFLGQEMMNNSNNAERQRLKSNDGSTTDGYQTGSGANDFQATGPFSKKNNDNQISISVGRDFEVHTAPLRTYTEMPS